MDGDDFDTQTFVIGKLSLHWGRFPSELKALPVGELALMWTVYVEELSQMSKKPKGGMKLSDNQDKSTLIRKHALRR